MYVCLHVLASRFLEFSSLGPANVDVPERQTNVTLVQVVRAHTHIETYDIHRILRELPARIYSGTGAWGVFVWMLHMLFVSNISNTLPLWCCMRCSTDNPYACYLRASVSDNLTTNPWKRPSLRFVCAIQVHRYEIVNTHVWEWIVVYRLHNRT